jgi:hypothetical protein
MSKKTDPAEVVDRLRKAGMTVERCKIGKPVKGDDREFVKILGYNAPPPAIDALYDEFDGFTVIWRGTLLGTEVQGSINIQPYSASASRAPKEEKGAPLEGVLWTDDSPDDARSRLKKMTIFESVTGRSQFLTYVAGGKDPQLSLVERDQIRDVVPDFADTITTLFTYAGVDGLRELLVQEDWQKRIADDPLFKQIAAWK